MWSEYNTAFTISRACTLDCLTTKGGILSKFIFIARMPNNVSMYTLNVLKTIIISTWPNISLITWIIQSIHKVSIAYFFLLINLFRLAPFLVVIITFRPSCVIFGNLLKISNQTLCSIHFVHCWNVHTSCYILAIFQFFKCRNC